jgi:hypothetical protein
MHRSEGKRAPGRSKRSRQPVVVSLQYERLFQLNRCLEQVAEILEQFRQEGLVHADYAESRKHSVENLRADLSHVITRLLQKRELETCATVAQS